MGTIDILSGNYRHFVRELSTFCPSPILGTRINTGFSGCQKLLKYYKYSNKSVPLLGSRALPIARTCSHS